MEAEVINVKLKFFFVKGDCFIVVDQEQETDFTRE